MLLITGASGRVGQSAAALLAEQGYPLRLMTRTPERISSLAKNSAVEVVYGNFADSASLENAFAGISAALVISGSGRPGERAEMHRNAFAAAARAGVGHVIYLSLQGAAPDSKYPYSRDHSISEQYLAATGLAHTVLRNAFYLDMFPERFDSGGTMRGPGGEGRGAFLSREDAARCAAAVLVSPPGGIRDVTGPEALSLSEAARRLSVLTGRELRYVPESSRSARERLAGEGLAPWQVDLAAGWFEAIGAGELQTVSDAVSRFAQRRPLRLEEYFSGFPALLQPLRDLR